MSLIRSVAKAVSISTLAIVAVIWYYAVAPLFLALPKDFNYQANINSVDNFYDENTQTFSGEQDSLTKFSYEVVSSSPSRLTIKNTFDVRTPQGEKIISLARLYGIDPVTGAHIKGLGDKNRSGGFLFAPRNLKEGESFTYWHINYDGPARMNFVAVEDLYGLPVFHYETHYSDVVIDQTNNLTNLPGVPEKRGVTLNPYLEIWVEPVTGWLIKYRDKTTAYYYDRATGVPLNPWNTFSNTYSEDSVQDQVANAQELKLKSFFIQDVVPGFFLVVALVLAITWLWGKKAYNSVLAAKKLTFFGAFVVFLFSITVTVGVYVLTANNVNRQLALQFQNHANQITSFIQSRMDLYTNTVYGLQGLFSASKTVEEDEWQAYIKQLNIPRNFPGISAVAYAKRVARADVKDFPYSIYPATDKEEYFPTTYSVVNLQSNATSAPLGFDLSSEDLRRTTLEKARDTGVPLSTPVVLTINGRLPSFSVYAPVYKNGQPKSTILERRKALEGFIIVSFRVQPLFENLASNPIFDKNIQAQIFAASTLGQASTGTLLYDSSGPVEQVSTKPGLALSSHVAVQGRIWMLHFKALPNFQSEFLTYYQSPLVLIVGGIFSILLVFIVFSFARSRERAFELARRATRELEDSRNDLQSFLDSLTTFVTRVSLDGKVLFANQSAKIASGLGENFIGTDFLQGSWFTFDAVVAERVSRAFKKVLRGSALNYDETVQLNTPEGVKILVINFSMIPIFHDKKVEYVIAEGRDITADKKIEEDLWSKTVDLERANRLMVDRELRMIELKEQLRVLQEKISKKRPAKAS